MQPRLLVVPWSWKARSGLLGPATTLLGLDSNTQQVLLLSRVPCCKLALKGRPFLVPLVKPTRLKASHCPACSFHLHAAVELRGCTFPLTALLALRNAMPRLRHLVVDIAGCGATDSSTLQSVLLLLLRPQARTMQLGRLQYVGCPAQLDTVEVQRCVTGQLQGYYGVTGVDLTVTKRTP